MIANESDRHLSVLDFDELDLEPAAPELRRRIEGHASRCVTCAERLTAHAALTAHFRASVFPRTATSVAARRRDWPWHRWAAWLAVPVAAALVLRIVDRHHRGSQPPGDPSPDGIGVKGAGLFEVFARRNGPGFDIDGPTVVRVSDGMRLAPGDALRFILFPSDLPYVLIASVDGAGQVNIYYPFHGEESALVNGRGAVSVPGSIVLDAAPGPERLFVIYSPRSLRASAVRAALGRAAAGGASAIRGTKQVGIDGIVQASLLFEKEDPR